MQQIRLPESELKVMAYIWDAGEATAKVVSEYMLNSHQWKKNTTYTVLNNLVSKKILERKEPDFLCVPIVSREQVGKIETKSLLEKFYNGSVSALFSAFLNDQELTQEELDEIKKMIDNIK